VVLRQDGKQQGPVPDAELARLIGAGVVTADTLVWHAGMENWQPCGSVTDAPAWPSRAPAWPVRNAGVYSRNRS